MTTGQRRAVPLPAAGPQHDEHKEELEAASKITCFIIISSIGGLIGNLSNASEISDAGADAVDGAAYDVAICFTLFATAVLSMFVMTALISKKVPGIAEPRIHQRRFITVIRLANALLLCSLASAAFAAVMPVAAIMPVAVKVLVWAMGCATVLGGFYAFFLHAEPKTF